MGHLFKFRYCFSAGDVKKPLTQIPGESDSGATGRHSMRKLIIGLLGAAALTTATGASAAITLDACSMSCTGPVTVGAMTTIGYSEAGLTNPFTEMLTFTNTLAGDYTISLDTSDRSVNFTSAVLFDGTNSFNLTSLFDNGTFELWGLGPQFFAAGQYTLTIMGSNTNTGALGGTVTIQSVPEPGTWAMMLLGFGAVGFAMRRKRRPAVMAQLA
jgi:PEP-CTERM motif-containing protein